MAGSRGRRHVSARATGILLYIVATVGACGSPAPSVTPAPTPTPTPVPTATPLPGTAVPAGYRPEGGWIVVFSRPGDVVREIFVLTLTCPDGPCDAIGSMLDLRGTKIGSGTFAFRDGRYVYESSATRTVDCEADGFTKLGGAQELTVTQLIIATFRIVGTANERQTMQGSRTVTIEPGADSGCTPSMTVYPALGLPGHPA